MSVTITLMISELACLLLNCSLIYCLLEITKEIHLAVFRYVKAYY